MSNLIAARQLDNLKPPAHIARLLDNFKKKRFTINRLSIDKNLSEYTGHVVKNKYIMKDEHEYIKYLFLDSMFYGEILLIKNHKNEILGTLGPNRVEKDEQGVLRARPGYFSVLPNYRNNGIGTILFWNGLKYMTEKGARYIKISVEKDNLSAIKVYQNCEMHVTARIN